MSGSPMISLVTIVRNDLNGIRRTLTSVQDQTFRNFEYIVVDGASNDGTKEFLEGQCKDIDSFTSEPDKSLYDAMNKGTERASGDWVLYLNAGDVLASSEALALAASKFENKDTVYFGRGRIEFDTGEGWMYPPQCISDKNCKFWLRNNLPTHQAIFFPKSFYQQNRYRLDLKISADSDYKERALATHNYTFLNQVVSRFVLGGVSTERTFKSQFRQAQDRFKRLSAPRKYIDFPLSLLKSSIRYFSYHLIGNRSYFIIHWLKSRFECARANLKYRLFL